MTTMVREVIIPGGPNPLGVQPFSEGSKAMAAMTKLTAWWTAGVGHEGSGWRDRKNGHLLIPAALPSYREPPPSSGGPNGSQRITLTAATTRLVTQLTDNILPLNGSFSLCFVARPAAAANGNGCIFGNAEIVGADRMQFAYSGADPAQSVVFATSTTAINSVPTGNGNVDGYKLFIASYEYISATSMKYVMRRNGVEVSTNGPANQSAQLLTNQQLTLFSNGTAPNTFPFRGDFIEGGVYAGALAASDNVNDLAAIENYISERLGIF